MRPVEIPGFGDLTQAEKLLLVEEIWDDISTDPQSVPVPQSHIDELERRLNRHRSSPGRLLSLEELQQRVQMRQ